MQHGKYASKNRYNVVENSSFIQIYSVRVILVFRLFSFKNAFFWSNFSRYSLKSCFCKKKKTVQFKDKKMFEILISTFAKFSLDYYAFRCDSSKSFDNFIYVIWFNLPYPQKNCVSPDVQINSREFADVNVLSLLT